VQAQVAGDFGSCSAELHSAVSPICNRQRGGGSSRTEACRRLAGCNPAIRQISNLRYGRRYLVDAPHRVAPSDATGRWRVTAPQCNSHARHSARMIRTAVSQLLASFVHYRSRKLRLAAQRLRGRCHFLRSVWSSVKGLCKINSGFAGGDFACWRGTTKEHSQGSATEEKRSQKAKSPQPSGAGRRLAGCGVARRSQPQNGDAPSSRLASGQAALPPKPEVIFAQTLSRAS